MFKLNRYTSFFIIIYVLNLRLIVLKKRFLKISTRGGGGRRVGSVFNPKQGGPPRGLFFGGEGGAP